MSLSEYWFHCDPSANTHRQHGKWPTQPLLWVLLCVSHSSTPRYSHTLESDVNSLSCLKHQAQQRRRGGLLMSPLLLLLAVRPTSRQVPPDGPDSRAAINGPCWRRDSVCADLFKHSQQFLSFDFNLLSASSVFPTFLDSNTEMPDFKRVNLLIFIVASVLLLDSSSYFFFLPMKILEISCHEYCKLIESR